MNLAQFEPSYGDFFVPTFVAKVGGDDMVRDLFLAVTQVEVELKEKAAGHFSVTIASAFDWELREFTAGSRQQRVDPIEVFAFGATVEIAIGYGEPAKLKPMITGIVTEVSTSFPASGTPELTISGYDALYPLTIGKSTRHWEQAPDSDAVQTIADEGGLDTIIVTTEPVKDRIDQNEETDFAFLTKLADRNAATFYVRDAMLYFGPRQNTLGEAVELVWGEGLVSFSPTANLANQITEVEVSGWSAADGQAVVGRARQGDESDLEAGRESGAGRVATALGREPVLRVRAAVHTQAEADARARAILEDRAQEFVTGDGECIGLPDILPDTNIALAGLGRAFNKKYYVSEANHSLGSTGYRTRFKVRENTV